MQNQIRVIIENASPSINNSEFAIKRIVNQIVNISADVLADGHDVLQAEINFKHEKEKKWTSIRMNLTNNDVFEGSFKVAKQGNYSYFVEDWVDYEVNWQYGIGKKINDNQNIKSELLQGAEILKTLLKQVSETEKKYLDSLIKSFKTEKSYETAIIDAVSDKLKSIFIKYPSKFLANKTQEFPVYVDREKALFSTWYEFFPRSSSSIPGQHGTFKDCENILPRIANMGFDTLYFPPIHPIGEVNRKGKNNATNAEAGDVGSPWGIGSQHGGHQALHPDLGTKKDFKSLVEKAKSLNIEIALDFALQAAPDHPYVKDFPQWFKWCPDGTVQYAENPPKKYQDILSIYFESKDWKNLWKELLNSALYWVTEFDIKVFRVDNSHTKPFYFWGWLIAEIKKKHPDVLFLSEAFIRPKIMYQLAKQGFTQGYTYFTWRNTKT